MNNPDNVNAIGNREIENNVRSNDKHSEVFTEVVAALAQFGLVREQL